MGSRFARSSASGWTWTSSVAARRCVPITSRAMPRTSTGATSTRHAIPVLRRIPGSEARGRRRGRPHVQARRLRRVSRRPRRGARGRVALRALVSRAVAEVKGGADALVLLPPPSRAQRRALVGRASRRRTRSSASSATAPRRRAHRRATRCVACGTSRSATSISSRREQLVFITQQVDPRHPALAATVPKIRSLAGLVDEVVVLADGAVSGVLPDNCRVRTFRARYRRCAVRFETAPRASCRACEEGRRRAHVPDLRGPRGPLVRPLRVPLVLWFTHWRSSDLLKAAECSTAVTSVDYRSFPLASRKLRAIGHGIDLDEFPCRRRARFRTRLLALGRYSTAKGLDVAVAAVPLAGDDVELHVYGPCALDDERIHRAELEELVRELGLEERVTIGDSVPRSHIPELFANTTRSCRCARQGRLRGRGRASRCSPPTRSSTSSSPPSSASPAGIRVARRSSPRARGDEPWRTEPSSGTRFASVSPSHSIQSWARGILDAAGMHDRRRRPPHPEGGGHLRLGGAPPAASARSARARLGRAVPHAPRGRARRLGVRLRAARTRRPARRHPPTGRRRPHRVRRGFRLPRARAPRSSTPTSCTPTSTGSSPAP